MIFSGKTLVFSDNRVTDCEKWLMEINVNVIEILCVLHSKIVLATLFLGHHVND